MMVIYAPLSSHIDVVKKDTIWESSAKALASSVILEGQSRFGVYCSFAGPNKGKSLAKTLSSPVVLEERNAFENSLSFQYP